MWITWKNTATSADGEIKVDTKLDVDFDLRMYGVGLDTGYFAPDSSKAMSAANGPYTMQYFLLFNNPYLTAVTPNLNGGKSTEQATLAYDAVVANVDIATGAGSVGVSRDTAAFTFKTPTKDGFSDSYCTGEAIANCSTDANANSDWTTPPTGDLCTEKWNLKEPHIRCVRI